MSKASTISAIVYLGVSALAAGLFLAATLAGEYTAVTRIGGTAWVFMLSNIVLMPVVIPAVKKRLGVQGQSSARR